MPEALDEQVMAEAKAAVLHAQRVRRTHRRRTAKKAEQRIADIDMARERLFEAMQPLRSEIGRFRYGPQTVTAEANRDAIRAASAAIQRERRKLWKMRRTKDAA